MKKWMVQLQTTVDYQIEVEADTREEAGQVAEEIWCQSDDPIDDFCGQSNGVWAQYADEIKD